MPSPAVEPSLVIDEAAKTAALEKEVREFYRQWAQTALDQDWKAHALTYAPQVDYYRDGLVARANVMTRKQRVLSGLQRTYLKFATTPQVSLREREGTPSAEITAELTFDKTWDLLRGKDRSAGKAQTQLTLQRQADEASWQIVSERQLRLYANALPPEAAVTAQPVKAKPTVARPAVKKQQARKPARKASATVLTTRPRVAKPRIRP